MILRRLLPSGIHEFRRYLAECRDNNPTAAVPRHLLKEDLHTAVVEPQIEVLPQIVGTKAEAAEYLADLLKPLPERDLATDDGLWTWLSLYFFDQICRESNGKLSVKNDYHYIFEPNNPRHFYRHLLFISWRVRQIAPDHNRIMLDSPLSSLNRVTTEIMKRLYLTRIPCIFEVLDRLYWDTDRGRVRPGIVAAKVKRGDLVHRFPVRVRQLEKTYDLHSLNADQFIELLGKEFRQNGAG